MKAKEWAIRIDNEAQMHEENCFLTLTYAPEHLPRFGSLRPPDMTLFLKRLRKGIHPKRIRYFYCGEYGDKKLRAHYHAIIFGWHPQDGTLYATSPSGTDIYNSETLSALWTLGHVNFSFLNSGTAEYVGRYVCKKITGPAAKDHYVGLDLQTGETGPREPEFARMSRRPGLGATWYRCYYRSDCIPTDSMILEGGRQFKIPRYYDKLTEREKGEAAVSKLKKARRAKAIRKGAQDERSISYRLEARENNTTARMGQMKRN